jgi:hypothetical protein
MLPHHNAVYMHLDVVSEEAFRRKPNHQMVY